MSVNLTNYARGYSYIVRVHMLELSTLSLVLSPEDESLVPPSGVQRLRCLPKVRFYTGANKNCLWNPGITVVTERTCMCPYAWAS